MRTKTNGKDLLNEKIRKLELQQADQLQQIKSSYAGLLDSLKPSNLVSSAMKNVLGTPRLKSTFVETIISAGAGILGKKMVVKKSGNIFRKIAGLATQFLITNLVRNKIPDLKNRNKDVELIDND